jgi:DinB superfamily
MSDHTLNPDPRYPIGKYQPKPYSESLKQEWLNDIRQLPVELEYAIQNLDETQLHQPYREGGWTIHQLVHHVADSHVNAYIRLKLALTENEPLVKPYEEGLWAELNDVRLLPVNISITLLHALHARLFATLKDLTAEQWLRTYQHPSRPSPDTVWYLMGSYSWHGKHHTAHILEYRRANKI